ncbi:MAG: DNA internalization-related competence protein ComEC/Rec2 [Oscillospiraceae bacterium]|nr:DNA internalization-related competence protein ComEC/Rec2 [Oscillospiraceae bacterium]
MRKLMWFSMGFAVACMVGAYLLSGAVLYAAGACLLLLALIGLWLFRNTDIRRKAAMLCAGMAVGLIVYQVYDGVYLQLARAVDGKSVAAHIRATDFSYDTNYGVAVDGETELNGRKYAVRAYVNSKERLSPGDVIEGTFRLRFTAAGGLEEVTHHRGEGIFLLAYPTGEQQITAAQGKAWYYAPAYLRTEVLRVIGRIFPADVQPFVKALLMGDTSELDYVTDTQLKLSGIRHVVAVSGLHVSILFSAMYLITGRRRILTALLGVPVLGLFAAMAGFSPSILRACIMQMLMLLAMLCNREYDPPTALSFAALVMLTGNPQTITSVGFQLSVASVAGIFLFSEKLRMWLMASQRLGRWDGKSIPGRLARGVATSVSISLSATVITTPLCAWYFGTVSLVAAVTNLLCLWVVTFLFCGIILACILGAIWLPAGSVAAWVLAWPVQYILGVAGVLAQFPLAAVYTQSIYACVWLMLCYVLLAVHLLSKQKRPLVLACCMVLGLCVALLVSWAEPQLDDYRVTAVDVGQGQCILLQSQGKTYMVDCGGDYDETTADTVAAILLSQGIYQLDGVILTHYDRDHVGAAAHLMTRVPTLQLILPEGDGKQEWEPELLEVYGDVPIYAAEDLQLSWGTASITVYASGDLSTSNESSLCVLFHTEKCDILITGDRGEAGEVRLLADHTLPDLDALIVGHHGAASSTGTLLLEKTKPETAIISVGEDNRYGHPSQTVLDRLHTYGCLVRRTDQEGTIILRG